MTGIGVIGCGKQAEKHIESLSKIGGIDITVADLDAARAESFAKKRGVAVAATVDALFNDASLQAILICTPTPSHVELILKAMLSGKDFFCEKPLCQSLAEAETIVKTCGDRARVGLVGYIYRYAPVFRYAHDALRQPAATSVLGAPVMATLRIGGRGSHQLWKHRQETGGGAMSEMFIHMLDLAVWLFGPVADASLLKKELLRPKREINGKVETVDAEDLVLAELIMKSGARVYVQADLLTPGFSQHIEIQGERGSFMGSIQPEIPARVFASHASGDLKAGWNSLSFPPVNLLDEQMKHFIQVLREKNVKPLVPVFDSLEVLRVMDNLQSTIKGEAICVS